MKRTRRRSWIIAVTVTILLALLVSAVWVAAVERWIGHELHVFAAKHVNPTFAFDDLGYRFPRTVTLRGVRLTSADPKAKSGETDILTVASLTLSLAEIPQPNRPFLAQLLDLSTPTLRLVRVDSGETSDKLLGFSNFLKETSEPDPRPAPSPAKVSELFQARTLLISDGRVEFDQGEDSKAVMLVEGIDTKLVLQPDDAGAYGVEFSLDHEPISSLALRGKLLVDDKKFEIAASSCVLKLAREQDHYLTPAVQRFLTERDITGNLKLEVTGVLDFGDAAASKLHADLDLDSATFAAGDYQLALDQVVVRVSFAGEAATIEEFAIDALGGHAKIGGKLDFDDSLTSALTFEATDLQISGLLRGGNLPKGVPLYSGLLGLSGTLLGPLTQIEQSAQGTGNLSLREARLGRVPILATIDEALDDAAEALMKREQKGRDVLSLNFEFAGDHARIEKLRMNSRWYGLRGHGDVFFDSRLDMAVDGGPIQRLENELGAVGDVLGEITESIVRARVTGTLDEPKIGIEVLRHGFP